ncbi:sugar kinase [Cryptosporangium sp. NPDC048952]|uniref:sugar kinase n=1 Tax=Cryptosporangium sp. NPDC048952 TaxID=3363961 RepID=UPI0037160429
MSFDVVCVGEAMALVTPDPPGPLASGGPMRLDVAGAESTVASYLAQLGARTAWVSAVGADPLGSLVCSRIASYGVDVSTVVVDPSAPTGVFFKDPGASGTTVHYYRAGSAASRLGPSTLPSSRVVHLSGITPALSSSCAALVDAVFDSGVTASFDVNYRPGLWSVEQAAPVLAGLARRADVVFVGLDEARTLWGVRTAADVRELLPEPERVIVKDGAVGAYSDACFVPAPTVDVVEPVGAGDAFAAGYLFGLLNDAPESERLRLGHQLAGAALRVTGDVARLSEARLEGSW